MLWSQLPNFIDDLALDRAEKSNRKVFQKNFFKKFLALIHSFRKFMNFFMRELNNFHCFIQNC